MSTTERGSAGPGGNDGDGDASEVPAGPTRPEGRSGPRLAVLACMDARLDPAVALGLGPGEAHVIRNAGGVATDDAIRSLVVSQRLLGTEEIVLVHHTDCGMEKFSDAQLKEELLVETGLRPAFSFEAFPDAEEDLKQTAARIRANPFVPHRQRIRAVMFDVAKREIREVPLD